LLRSRLLIEWSAIALFAAAVIVTSLYTGVTRRFDNLLYDAAAVWHAAPPDDRILIVEIDNRSLSEIGKWQWPRDVHARMVARLAEAQTAVTAYDILFTEPAVAADDDALATAMAAHKRVTLPVLYSSPGLNGADHDIALPIEPLTKASAGLGTVNLLFDQDGLIRRAQLETRSEAGSLQHLMEESYRIVIGKPSAAFGRLVARTAKDATLDDDSGSLLIPFSPAGSFRHVSFSSVLSGEVPAGFLKGKIVLVGATADGMGDRYPVAAAAGSTMAGVEIQANLLNGMLHDRFIYKAPFWLSLVSALVPVLLLMLLFLRLRPTVNLLVSLAMIAAVLAASMIGIALAGYWVAPGPALLGLLLVYPLWGWRRLEALSSFVFHEAKSLRAEAGLALAGDTAQRGGLDSIATQAMQLRHVIGELRGVRRFMSDVVTGFPDAICVVDEDGLVTLANTAAFDVLGADSVGKTMTALLERASPGHGAKADEVTLSDGRTLLIRTVPLTNDAGTAAGSIIRLADISRLRDADREREELLEFLSHDMRAPQAAIITLLESEKGTRKGDPLLEKVEDNARKTLKLAEDFVQNARLSSADLQMEDVNIASAMAEAIDVVWPQAQRKKIAIVSEGLELEAFITGDHGALVRAFTNLIDNAVKYSADGTQVHCSVVLESQKRVRCVVSDQGPGLPAGRTDDVFARFGARGDTKTTGSGLGLAYVKKVVDRHKGEIKWTSDAGTGTSFTLHFPVVAVGDEGDV
jgi:CHASE2 domain-containing sensor protein/signal transduction histidine kinase